MSIVAEQLVVKIVTDASGAKEGIKSVGDESKSSGGFVSNLLSTMGGFIGGAAITNVAAGAFGFLKDQITGSYQAGMAANQIQDQIVAGLKSTNDASGQTAAGLEDYATKLSNATGIGKDAVASAQSMELTFTGIAKDTFPLVTQAAADMATKFAGGAIPNAQQMQQQSLLLGKALNDPLKGISALTREGVTFSDEQKKQIKLMMQHGDVAGAQGVMLKELNKEFGGSAVAAGQANGGLAILNTQWANMKEQLGQQLIPVMSQLLTGLSPIITAAGNLLPGALQALTGIINTDVMPAVSAISGWIAGDGMKDLHQLGDFITGTVVPAFKELQKWVMTYVVPALVQLGNFIVTTVLPAAKQMAEWFMVHVMPVLAVLAQVILQNVLPTLEGLVGIILKNLVPALEHLWNVIAPILMPVLQALGWLLQNVIGPALGFVIQMVSKAIDNFASFIGSIESFVKNPSVANLVSILQNIGKLMSGGVGDLISGKISLPHFADGGTMAQSGFALVGERGPEIVKLPGGAQVFPNGSVGMARPASGSGGSSSQQPIIIQVDGRTLARTILPHMTSAIYNATGARGVTGL